jgi:membrane-associated phospholipid phosphatase
MRRYRMRLRRSRPRDSRTPVLLPSHSARRLALLGVGAGALVVPIWAWTTLTVEGQRIADLVLYGRVLATPAALGAAWETLATVSLASGAIVALGLAVLGLVRGGFGLATATLVIVAGANATSQALQVMLERPNLLGHAAYAVGNSFPSGHVTLVASLGFACILVVPRRMRTPVVILVSVIVAVIGVSTITAGWHRLADVVGAVLIALAWASLVTAALVRAQGWMPRRTWGMGHGGWATRLAGLAGAGVIIAGIVSLVVAALDPAPLRDAAAAGAGAAEPRTFVAALVVTLGSALVGFAAYEWAMRGVALEAPR